MRTPPFNVERHLNVPPSFSISVYARISGARFMAVAPSGDLLVSQPGTGKVLLVRPTGNDDPLIYEFATGLRRPHDIVFHTIGPTTYVYIAETHQINRFIYRPGDTAAHDREIVVANLPDSSSPELRGAYGHELKNIALDANDKLYVSIASTCNACLEDTVSDPVRGSIYQYSADGGGGRLFARGLRNAEGLAFVPGTTDLWVVVNNRDQIPYPFNDGSGNYGQLVADYIDDHPPEEFTRVRDGGNYGWPFCNPNPDTASGLDDMPFDQDYEFNRDGHVDCAGMDRIDKGIQAHSAPLGLTFLQGTAFPSHYREGAVVGLHGSWNRQRKTGYKVIYYPWQNARPGEQVELVSGWLNEDTQEVWGRPVDVAVDLAGDLLISDDYSGTIYKLSYRESAPAPTPTPTPEPTPAPTPTPEPAPAYTLSAAPGAAEAGATIAVSWAAPAGHSATDWVGLYRAGASDYDFLAWQYAGGAGSGLMSFAAPAEPGRYELRYFLNDGFERAATSNAVEVGAPAPTPTPAATPTPTPGPTPAPAYALTAAPGVVAAGGTISVNWSAPADHSASDWVGLYRVGASDYEYLAWQYTGGSAAGVMGFAAPAEPGQYELRYFLEDGFSRVLVSDAVTVPLVEG